MHTILPKIYILLSEIITSSQLIDLHYICLAPPFYVLLFPLFGSNFGFVRSSRCHIIMCVRPSFCPFGTSLSKALNLISFSLSSLSSLFVGQTEPKILRLVVYHILIPINGGNSDIRFINNYLNFLFHFCRFISFCSFIVSSPVRMY